MLILSWDGKSWQLWDTDAECRCRRMESGRCRSRKWVRKLILKRKLNVSYQAIDENGNKLTFRSQPGADGKCLEGYTLADKITESKLNMLKNVQCTDSSKVFRYWAVMADGVLMRIDPESTLLEQRFSGKNEQTGKYNGSVVLYAVFGAKENA